MKIFFKTLKNNWFSSDALVYYFFTLSYIEWSKYEQLCSNEIWDNVSMEDFINFIDEQFVAFDLKNELLSFLTFINFEINKKGVKDPGVTFSNIFLYILDLKVYEKKDILFLMKFVRDSLKSFWDGDYWYYNILIGLIWLEHNYLSNDNKMLKYIFSEFEKNKNTFSQLSDYKANFGVHKNNLYRLYKWLSYKEYCRLLHEKKWDRVDYNWLYWWYWEFL